VGTEASLGVPTPEAAGGPARVFNGPARQRRRGFAFCFSFIRWRRPPVGVGGALGADGSGQNQWASHSLSGNASRFERLLPISFGMTLVQCPDQGNERQTRQHDASRLSHFISPDSTISIGVRWRPLSIDAPIVRVDGIHAFVQGKAGGDVHIARDVSIRARVRRRPIAPLYELIIRSGTASTGSPFDRYSILCGLVP